MKVNKQDKENLISILTLDIEPSDYREKVVESLKKYAKTAQIKGFRKGHVPKGMVKKLYGNAILADEIQHLVNLGINDFIRDNELRTLGQPLPIPIEDQEPIDINNMGEVKFSYEIGLTPDVEVPLLEQKPSFVKYDIAVEDELVDKEIETILQRNGSVENPEKGAEEKDVINILLDELDETGLVKPGGYNHVTTFMVEQLRYKKDKEAIKKLKVGDSIDEFDLYKAFDKEKGEIAKMLLELDESQMDEIGYKFKLTLNKINRVKPAEPGQEFYDKVYGKDVVESEEEFREKVRGEIKNYLNQAAQNKLRDDVFRKFAKETDVNLPDDFLKRWLKTTKEEGVEEADIDHEYYHFSDDLKTSLIFGKIAEIADLKVESEELKERMRETVIQQFQYYGIPIAEDEQRLDEMVMRFMQDEKQIRQTHDQIMDGKIFEYLLTKVTIEDKQVTLDEFNALSKLEEEHEHAH